MKKKKYVNCKKKWSVHYGRSSRDDWHEIKGYMIEKDQYHYNRGH